MKTQSAASGGQRIQPKDLRCEERQCLPDVIPLPAPYVVYIEPSNLCNFRCRFCPTADKDLLRKVGRPSGSMGIDLFKKIIGDLGAFPNRIKLLSLYKDGEPTINRAFSEMVRYAKASGVAERIWTKTNGSMLSPSFNEEIVSAGLDMVHISVEGVSAHAYQTIADVSIDYGKLVENIADLYARRRGCRIYIKIADAGLTAEEVEKFHHDFQPICDYIGIEKLMGWSHSDLKDFTLGTRPNTYDGLPLVPKVVCAYPFYVMAVNWNGAVSLCGNDWAHKTVVGDASRQSMRQIWEGDEMFEFRKMMLEGRRKENPACGNCYYLQIVPDNIDKQRKDILANLTQERCHGARLTRPTSSR
ncbi:MAG: radical SAM/SPASM domain-containing protein [Verrucomicrobiae bacterium]